MVRKRKKLTIDDLQHGKIFNLKTGHSYENKICVSPFQCACCQRIVWGIASRACRCRACGIFIHRSCTMSLQGAGACPQLTKLLKDKNREHPVKESENSGAQSGVVQSDDNADSVEVVGAAPNSETHNDGHDDVAQQKDTLLDQNKVKDQPKGWRDIASLSFGVPLITGGIIGGALAGPVGAFTGAYYGPGAMCAGLTVSAAAKASTLAVGMGVGAYSGKKFSREDEFYDSSHDDGGGGKGKKGRGRRLSVASLGLWVPSRLRRRSSLNCGDRDLGSCGKRGAKARELVYLRLYEACVDQMEREVEHEREAAAAAVVVVAATEGQQAVASQVNMQKGHGQGTNRTGGDFSGKHQSGVAGGGRHEEEEGGEGEEEAILALQEQLQPILLLLLQWQEAAGTNTAPTTPAPTCEPDESHGNVDIVNGAAAPVVDGDHSSAPTSADGETAISSDTTTEGSSVYEATATAAAAAAIDAPSDVDAYADADVDPAATATTAAAAASLERLFGLKTALHQLLEMLLDPTPQEQEQEEKGGGEEAGGGGGVTKWRRDRGGGRGRRGRIRGRS